MSVDNTPYTFAVPLESLGSRFDVAHARTAKLTRSGSDDSPWPVQRLGDYLEIVQYGSSDLASRDAAGTPIIRMNNLQNDSWNFSDLKYVSLSPEDVGRYRLDPGDILVNRTNGSQELVGKSQVFREEGTWVFASYLIRLRSNSDVLDPDYVAAFLNSDAGRRQVRAASRQILMTNVSAAELRELRVPIPDVRVQEELAGLLTDGRRLRDTRLAQADELTRNLGNNLMERLGLPDLPNSPLLSFAVKLRDLAGRRLDAGAYQPIYQAGTQIPTTTALLSEVAEVNPNYDRPTSELVPYVGLPECSLIDVERVRHRILEDVQNRPLFRRGDILFARIEPSVFNKKYVWALNVPSAESIFTSTEFYVIRARPPIDQAYLFAALRSPFVGAQIRGRTTGSSGRRRIDRDLLETLQIPVAPPAVQSAISEETTRDLALITDLGSAAAIDWQMARSSFENALYGSRRDG